MKVYKYYFLNFNIEDEYSHDFTFTKNKLNLHIFVTERNKSAQIYELKVIRNICSNHKDQTSKSLIIQGQKVQFSPNINTQHALTLRIRSQKKKERLQVTSYNNGDDTDGTVL